MESYDLVVIGGGPGGYEAAAEAAEKYGMKTALVEARELGGTCLNRGCIPTKTLLHTAELFREVREEGERLGIAGGGCLQVDMEALQRRKEEVAARLREGIAAKLKKAGVRLITGRGILRKSGEAEVLFPDGTSELLRARNILVATGSAPAMPPIPGADNPLVLTSDEVLQLRRIPGSLVIIGGGVIGMEFAFLYSALGSRVTVIEAMENILPNMDKELSRNLKLVAAKNRGIEIHTKATVTEICSGGEGTVLCRYLEKEKECTASGEIVLMAVGRRPYFAGLADEKTAEEIRSLLPGRGPLAVDDHYRTAVSGIYAIGDVTGGVQLAHAAVAEGRNAVAAMNGEALPVRTDLIPACVYTDPEIASVGLTAEEAKERGLPVTAKKVLMGANGKSVLSGRDRGYVKILSETGSGRILGAQLMCDRATDLVPQLVQAMAAGAAIQDLGTLVFPHPTVAEAVGEVCRQ